MTLGKAMEMKIPWVTTLPLKERAWCMADWGR